MAGVWLGKIVCVTIRMYLPPSARYKVDVGGPPYNAVVYYHYAISLDPAKGKRILAVGMGGTEGSWQPT